MNGGGKSKNVHGKKSELLRERKKEFQMKSFSKVVEKKKNVQNYFWQFPNLARFSCTHPHPHPHRQVTNSVNFKNY